MKCECGDQKRAGMLGSAESVQKTRLIILTYYSKEKKPKKKPDSSIGSHNSNN